MKKGMIKVSVLYPNGDGRKFDMSYYTSSHIPMAKGLLGAGLKAVTIDRGLAGGAPGVPAPYLASAHLYFDTLDSFQSTFGPHAGTIMADVPNYTNTEPVIQICVVEQA